MMSIRQSAVLRSGSFWGFSVLTAVFMVSFFYHAPDLARFTICPLKALTGIDCPGCGLTHSFCALAKGHLGLAFRYHLLGPFLFVLSALVWARCGLVLAGRNRILAFLDRALRDPRVQWFALSVFLGYGITRAVAHLFGIRI